jgi:hypothetical protein
MVVPIVLAALWVAPAATAGMPTCNGDPSIARMSPDQVTARARLMGYKVRAMDPDAGCWRVEATDDRGRRVLLRLHAGTGELMARLPADGLDRSATAATD